MWSRRLTPYALGLGLLCAGCAGDDDPAQPGDAAPSSEPVQPSAAGAPPAQPAPLDAGLVLALDAGSDRDAPALDALAPPATYLPSESDFQAFHAWPSLAAEAPISAPQSAHSAAPMRVYINRRPPSGSQTFPVGTLIVKETVEEDPTEREVFALAKRGGGYNDGGAQGWEWFQLKNVAGGRVRIVWRGLGPPDQADDDGDGMYGGDPAVCNGCHFGARDNDYVWATGLSLRGF
jgi:hypothetical protein